MDGLIDGWMDGWIDGWMSLMIGTLFILEVKLFWRETDFIAEACLKFITTALHEH